MIKLKNRAAAILFFMGLEVEKMEKTISIHTSLHLRIGNIHAKHCDKRSRRLAVIETKISLCSVNNDLKKRWL